MSYLQDVVSNAVAIAAIDMLNVPAMLPAPTSEIGQYAKLGFLYAGAEEAVDWWMSGDSNLSKMSLMGLYKFVDNGVWDTLMVGGLTKSGLVGNVAQAVKNVSPASDWVNGKVITGAAITASKVARGMLDSSAFANNPVVHMLIHPTYRLQQY